MQKLFKQPTKPILVVFEEVIKCFRGLIYLIKLFLFKLLVNENKVICADKDSDS